MAKNIEEWIEYSFDKKELVWLKSPRYGINPGDIVGSIDRKGYRRFKFDGKNYSNHRYIFYLFNGYNPEEVDHKDNNRSNNDYLNLREANPQLNSYNKLSYNKNYPKGVSIRPNGTYRARCTVNRNRVSLGNFFTIADAVEALNDFRNQYHGEFANGGR